MEGTANFGRRGVLLEGALVDTEREGREIFRFGREMGTGLEEMVSPSGIVCRSVGSVEV